MCLQVNTEKVEPLVASLYEEQRFSIRRPGSNCHIYIGANNRNLRQRLINSSQGHTELIGTPMGRNGKVLTIWRPNGAAVQSSLRKSSHFVLIKKPDVRIRISIFECNHLAVRGDGNPSEFTAIANVLEQLSGP